MTANAGGRNWVSEVRLPSHAFLLSRILAWQSLYGNERKVKAWKARRVAMDAKTKQLADRLLWEIAEAMAFVPIRFGKKKRIRPCLLLGEWYACLPGALRRYNPYRGKEPGWHPSYWEAQLSAQLAASGFFEGVVVRKKAERKGGGAQTTTYSSLFHEADALRFRQGELHGIYYEYPKDYDEHTI